MVGVYISGSLLQRYQAKFHNRLLLAGQSTVHLASYA